MTFKRFLTEAQFSASTIDKVLVILERRARMALGQVFRYGGDDGKIELNLMGRKYDSYLYILPTKKAFRINTWRYNIESIDIWKDFIVDSPPNFTIDVQDFNSVNFLAIFDNILKVIKQPQAGQQAFYFLPEGVQPPSTAMLTEARRTTPLEFYSLCKQEYPTEDHTKMDWMKIAHVAAKHDVQVPSSVRAARAGKGLNSVVPPGVDSAGNVVDPQAADAAKNKGSEPILYIKVTAQDPTSKKFLPSGEVAQAQELYKKINGIIASEPNKAELEDADTLFGHLKALVQFTVSGNNKSLFIYGGPGTGKTHTVTETIAEQGLKKNEDWYHIKGKVTATALYQTLFMHRDGKLIVFDDCDSVFGNGDAINILKGALDSYDERTISWVSNRTTNVAKMSSEERLEYEEKIDEMIEADPADPKIKFPSEFTYTGRVIFISNLARDDMDTAILSRSSKIDMTLTPAQILGRIENNLDKLGGPDATREQKIEVLEYFKGKANAGELKDANMRMYLSALNLVKSGLPNWKELLRYTA